MAEIGTIGMDLAKCVFQAYGADGAGAAAACYAGWLETELRQARGLRECWPASRRCWFGYTRRALVE